MAKNGPDPQVHDPLAERQNRQCICLITSAVTQQLFAKPGLCLTAGTAWVR